VDDELIPRNPARSVKKPKMRGPKMRVLSSEQATALVKSVRGTRYEALYAVAVWLGPRQAELAALTWADVNPEGRLTRIWRSVNTDRAGEIWSSTKTGEEREIVLPESIAASLMRHRERAGLPRMRFNDLRDTAATLMIRGGVDVWTVADILGHADPAMTLRRYAHVLPDMRERAANLIDSYAV
jgi:integrase